MVDDLFGIRMLYPTKAGGQERYLNMQTGTPPTGRSKTRGSDSVVGTYFRWTEDQVRDAFRTNSNYDGNCNVEANHSRLDLNTGGRGYMYRPDDWRDVEMTNYWYVTSSVSGSDADVVLYCRGGRHSDSCSDCEGCAYKSNIQFDDGRGRHRKERWHNSGYDDTGYWTVNNGNLRNRWWGHKFICVNRLINGRHCVLLETWVDLNNSNTWVLKRRETDTGSQFCPSGQSCGSDSCQILNWGGPWATLRCDVGTDVRFTRSSVREINYDGTFGGTPPPPPGPGPGPPPSPPPGPVPPPPPPATGGPLPQETKLAVAAQNIVAIGDDGNVPANTYDDSHLTRWSRSGLPAWIRFDMGRVNRLDSVGIYWYRAPGESRKYGYNIESSLNNTTYAKIWDDDESESQPTTGLEYHNFTNHDARFVRINVLSNDVNTFASIIEVRLYGSTTPIGQPPPTPPPPNPNPTFIYNFNKHVYHVNFSVIDSCGPSFT